jgi:lipoprotein-anchoring transpeptidase ErfK/SrfK
MTNDSAVAEEDPRVATVESPIAADAEDGGAGTGAEDRPSSANGAPSDEILKPPFGRVRLEWRHRKLILERNKQLREITELETELRRIRSPRRDLVERRLNATALIDQELLDLERRLGVGIGGSCPGCGLHSSQTRFCLRCGERLEQEAVNERMSAPMVAVAVVAIALGYLMGGINFGGSSEHTVLPARRPAQGQSPPLRTAHHARPAGARYRSLVATAKGSQVAVYHRRGGRHAYMRLASPNLDGAPQVFLVRSIAGGWARVLLPTRPNGSSGWIHLSSVRLTGHSYRVLIDLRRHVLTAWNGSRKVMRTPVGVGRAVTPTPSGQYYITELLKQPDSTGTYGPWAFGLSVHSNVLHEFAGRDGVLGIHGTDFPQGVGTDVSHGCIRLSNVAITKLARTLPIGTPVRITRA